MLVLNLKIEKIHLQTNALMTYMLPSVQGCVFQRESHLQESANLAHLHFNNFESL